MKSNREDCRSGRHDFAGCERFLAEVRCIEANAGESKGDHEKGLGVHDHQLKRAALVAISTAGAKRLWMAISKRGKRTVLGITLICPKSYTVEVRHKKPDEVIHYQNVSWGPEAPEIGSGDVRAVASWRIKKGSETTLRQLRADASSSDQATGAGGATIGAPRGTAVISEVS